MSDPTSVSLSAGLLTFAACAGGVWYAAIWLTYCADALAERYNLARSTVGLLFLASATSLPEVATTFGAAAKADAELVLGNLFGGIALQTTMLAVGDLWARGAISAYPRKTTHALEATLLVGLLAAMQIALIMNEQVDLFWIGPGSLIVTLLYVMAILVLRRSDKGSDWVPVDLPDDAGDYAPLSMAPKKLAGMAATGLLLRSALACAAVLMLGVGLVLSADVIAVQSDLGSGFVGVSLLAMATSLPELTTTITAVRMGAYTLAISNVFGSNLIMLGLVFPADLLFTRGPILRDAGASISLAIALGIAVTVVYLVGFILRRKRRVGRLGVDSLAVFILYGLGLALLYVVR